MKKSLVDIRLIIILVAAILYTISSSAQNFNEIDKSPHDIVYYRVSRVATPLVKVVYGRPTVKETTKVFGSKIPLNQLWQTGANEATEIKLYDDVLFGDRLVNAGTYVLYTIPGEYEWEIILSSNTDIFDSSQYDSIFDVTRIKVPVSKAEKLATFSIGFRKIKENIISMVLAWGTTRVKIPLNLETNNLR